MKDKLREFFVILFKGVITALCLYLGRRFGIEIPVEYQEVATTLLAGATFGAVNLLLNKLADQLRKLPYVGPALNVVWPNPSYEASDLNGDKAA